MAVNDLLRGCPLFFELYDQEIEKIVKRCHVNFYGAGDFIIQDGEEGDEIFVVLEGIAMVQKRTAGGVIPIQELKQGDVFGEMVLVDVRKRSADIVANLPCSILEIKYDQIFSLFKKEPKIFGLMLLNLSRLLAQRLRRSNEKNSELQKTIQSQLKVAA